MVKKHVLGDGALLLSSIDLQRRRLRLFGENQYPVSQAISGGDADLEKISILRASLRQPQEGGSPLKK